MYSLVRLLPCYRLSRATGRQPKNSVGNVIYRVSTSRVSSPDEAGIHELHVNGDMLRGISEFTFEPLQTPFGVFNLHVTYRLDCDFAIESSDTVSTDRFVYQDHNYMLQSQRASSSIANSIRTRETSSSGKAENNDVALPASISAHSHAKIDHKSPDTYRFRTEDSPKHIVIPNRSSLIEHFTPPSFTSNSLILKRRVMKPNESLPPFIATNNLNLKNDEFPFAIPAETPPFVLQDYMVCLS